MHCYNQLSVTIFLLFSHDKEKIPLPIAATRKNMTFEFSIFLFRHKNERDKKCPEFKENMQLSIDMHCSHMFLRHAVAHSRLLVVARCMHRSACVQWLFAVSACH